MSTRPPVVIDTNVALDLLVFGDPRCAPLREAFARGHIRWIASAAMREELLHVLARGFGDRWAFDRERVVATWDGWVELRAEPEAGLLWCSDQDDQKFIDLALAHRPSWLLTRDRALLRLARRARERGVDVSAPGPWLSEAMLTS